MELMATKYEMMLAAPDDLSAILIHNACNMAMIHMAQVGGRIRRVWGVSKN